MLNPRDLSASHWCITYWKMFGIKCKYRYPNRCVVCGSLIGHWFHFEIGLKQFAICDFSFPCCHLNSASALLSNTWSRQWEWGRIVFFVMHTLLPVTTCYNVTFGISTLHTLHYMLHVLHRSRHKSDVYMELWWRININILCYQLNWWLNVAHYA